MNGSHERLPTFQEQIKGNAQKFLSAQHTLYSQIKPSTFKLRKEYIHELTPFTEDQQQTK